MLCVVLVNETKKRKTGERMEIKKSGMTDSLQSRKENWWFPSVSLVQSCSVCDTCIRI